MATISLTPSTPVVVTTTTTTSYGNFEFTKFVWDPVENTVAFTCNKTDTNNIVSVDTWQLSQTEMAALASMTASTGETFLQVAGQVVQQIIMMHYGITSLAPATSS